MCHKHLSAPVNSVVVVLCFSVVYMYAFNGANFVVTTTDAKQGDYKKIFENGQIQILFYQHHSTEEAHNAKLTALDCRITDTEIFTSKGKFITGIDWE